MFADRQTDRQTFRHADRNASHDSITGDVYCNNHTIGLYTVSQKNVNDVAHYKFNAH